MHTIPPVISMHVDDHQVPSSLARDQETGFQMPYLKSMVSCKLRVVHPIRKSE